MRRIALTFAPILLFVSISAAAKRVPPKQVPPIVANGVEDSTAGDGRDSYVGATDKATWKTLWKVKVFHTRVEWWRREEDNQWLFISDLKLTGSSLLARDEKNRCYLISLSTQRVKKAPCGDAFPLQAPRR
jgi:hypothetical protein